MSDKSKKDSYKRVFDVMQGNTSDYSKFEELKECIDLDYNKFKGEENQRFYCVLNILMNAINNAGWEKKKDEIMDCIRKQQEYIADEYEEFLP